MFRDLKQCKMPQSPFDKLIGKMVEINSPDMESHGGRGTLVRSESYSVDGCRPTHFGIIQLHEFKSEVRIMGVNQLIVSHGKIGH